jgi:hypothetical protein
MYCRNCGKEVSEKAVECPGCGVPPRLEKNFCHNCGCSTQSIQALCVKCGANLAGNDGIVRLTLAWSSLSLGAKIAAIGAALELLMFFSPWLEIWGTQHRSGMQYAFSNLPVTLVMLLVPATALETLWILYRRVSEASVGKPGPSVRLVGNVIAVVLMTLICVVTVKQYGSQIFTGWFWLAFAASISVVVGAVKDRLPGKVQ